MKNNLVIVRGGGDIATGTIHRLVQCGFNVVVLEMEHPTVIRRRVSFANAIYTGSTTIEGVEAGVVEDVAMALESIEKGIVPLLKDPEGKYIKALKPCALVDAILAKRNMGTSRDMAPIVVGIGPGFVAEKDVDAVIETMRGHNLGRVLYKGTPQKNTGIPGDIKGYSRERVIRSPRAGSVHLQAQIGDLVEQGQLLGSISQAPIVAPIKGVIRGLIYEGTEVPVGFKIGDIDPRGNTANCYTISDKARAVAGGVLEAILHLSYEMNTN